VNGAPPPRPRRRRSRVAEGLGCNFFLCRPFCYLAILISSPFLAKKNKNFFVAVSWMAIL
jgi:hypothetical protein